MGRLGTDKQSRYSHQDSARYRRSSYGTGDSSATGPLEDTDAFSRASELSRAQENRGRRAAKRARDIAKARQEQLAQSVRPDYSPSAGNYRARYAQREPSDLSLAVRAALVAVLLVALIATFATKGENIGRLGSLQSELSEAHTQLDETTASNDELAEELEARETVIEAYEAL